MLIEKWTKGDRVLEIHIDEDARNPRKEFDQLGVMYCWHRVYRLGDKPLIMSLQTLYRTELVPDGGPCLKLYLTAHSGVSMRTVPFEHIYDDGHIGYIHMPKEIQERGGLTEEQALECLQAEVRLYDHYLAGRVFGYSIYTLKFCPECGHKERKDEDSCWGFYGSDHKESGLLVQAELESLEGWTNAKI